MIRAIASIVACTIAAGAVAAAQQGRQGGGRGGAGRGAAFAPPPIVWPSPPLPDGPITIETAEPAHRRVRLTVVKGLSHPWGMAFLPDGAILITERGGQLRVVRGGRLDPKPVPGIPRVYAQGLSGLMDLALHPRFSENRLVYFTYHRPRPGASGQAAPQGEEGQGQGSPAPYTLVLARGTWNGSALTDVRDVFDTGANGAAARIVFGRDGTIYMASGNATEGPNAPPQDPGDLRGKILRLRDDGSVPPDNPFVGKPGYRPEIYTMGHRNVLGLTVNPYTGEVWGAEQGPNGGDEVNIIRAGRNYGWPLVSHGRNYMGPRIGDKPIPGMEEPEIFWVPSIAVSGMTFYNGDKFPAWQRNLFVGGLRQGEVPRTGQLQRIVFNDSWQEIRREPMLRELQQRIRDVRQGSDGYLYLLTDEDEAALLRMEPAGAADTR